MMLGDAGYNVMAIARSVPEALKAMENVRPDLVLLDIQLQGKQTGIDLGAMLSEKDIAFIYISANTSKMVMEKAKLTRPYGFIVKPYREQDVLVMLDVALYLNRYKLEALKEKLAPKNISHTSGNDFLRHIVSYSPKMKDALEKVRLVSPSDTSVLICGESGTGKEVVAQAIHQLSHRRDKPLIVVNCAALPPSLIESELFGHEKGTFTGAHATRIGKFELADGGTIFLDEIGELPLDLQVRFLRVLQEKEIERIGGTPKKIDVRVIAATNKNLEDEVANQHFRLDLFYRLNIFPIVLPSLRERKEDILPLAEFFLAKYAEKERKKVTTIADQVVRSMMEYSWPGNVRELENLMARSVLLAMSETVSVLVLPKEKKRPHSVFEKEPVKTMLENERDHIIAILEKCDWKVYGAGGAAELLDINVSTLNSRMRKLGIEKPARPKKS